MTSRHLVLMCFVSLMFAAGCARQPEPATTPNPPARGNLQYSEPTSNTLAQDAAVAAPQDADTGDQAAEVAAPQDSEMTHETIHEAAGEGDLEDVRRHLQRGVGLEAKDENGRTPLLWAAMGGRNLVAEALIELGADVNAKGNLGETALHGAAFRGATEVAELLIDNGADVNAKNRYGATPLTVALSKSQADMVALLKRHGAEH